MSWFWSWWVVVLAVLTLGISLFLFVWGMWVRIPTQADGTTGHDWDGIREGMNKLPWWFVAYSTVIFLAAFCYLALYPGLGSFKGLLGWSSPKALQQDTAANNAKREARMKPWRALSIEQMATNKEAVGIGHRLFLDNCAGCHGRTALGNPALGAPDLTDAAWQFGGDGASIVTSILDGRNQVMPPWGDILGEDGVNEVTAYVLSLSGVKSREWQVRPGKDRFDVFCIACHGAGGTGRTAGTPSLADGSWLYGGDLADVTTSVRDGRIGVMPAWRTRLSDDQARLIAAWVLSKGPRERPTAE